MQLEGSCHCGAVSFSLSSAHPFPYQSCYCSICRKTQGGGGFAINIGGDANSLKVRGRKHISIYRARLKEDGDQRAHRSSAERHFCSVCGSGLWVFSPEWPELIHPFASAIDTELPQPPQRTHVMLGSKAPWVDVPVQRGDRQCDQWPEESIAEWHQRLGLER
jgi:hypothetical protein